jgi:hypothetical protein
MHASKLKTKHEHTPVSETTSGARAKTRLLIGLCLCFYYLTETFTSGEL